MQRKTNRIRASTSQLLIATAATSAVAGLVSTAEAVDIVRGTGGALNLTTSWVGGVVPGPDDVAVWDNSAASNTLGADLSFSGIRLTANQTAAVTLSGANVLTIGSAGIDLSAAAANLTIQTTPSVTTGINLGAAQTWNVAGGRLLQVANGSGAITGTGAITKTGLGTTYFNSASNSFSGGITVNQGAITFNTNSTVSTTTGLVTNGPVGTGVITLNSGTISTNTTSGRDIANDVKLTADSTVGLAATARFRSAGTWDLGGATRTLTLTNPGTGFGNSSEQFAFLGQGTAPFNKIFTLSNGNLRFVGGAATGAAAPALISFAQGSGGVFFQNNSSLTIGSNVVAFEGSSQTNAGTNSPKLTIESGGALLLSAGTQTKSFTAYSLAGAGTIGSAQTDGVTSVGILTVDGAAGSTSFAGTIQDVYNVFGSNYTGVVVNFVKAGSSTQVLTGTNTYTGSTAVNGGTLQLGSGTAGSDGTIAGTSGVAVAAGATLAYNRAGNTTAGYVISGSGAVTKSGAGTQTLSAANTYSGGTVVNGGTLVVSAAAATPLLSGTLTTGGTDIRNGAVTFTGGDPVAIRGLLASGFAASFASGTLRSSTATAARGLGYKSDGTGVTVKAAFYGDADLDGGVSINDFNALAGNFGQSTGRVWTDGDFDYDGGVSINDFNLLAGNFGQTLPASADSWSGLLAFAAAHNDLAAFEAVTGVPEPTSLGLIAAGATLGLRRRRRLA